MFRGSSQFDKLLEKATSNLLLEPDWATVLQICDCLRQGDVQPKHAVAAMKKKFYSENPHVAMFALQVLESCVKNCGTPIHKEIATKDFMGELWEIAKTNSNEPVKSKVLELIQTWAHAFRNDANYRVVLDTLNLMKVEGYKFPQLKESDAMFMADHAPEWADGECCHRCRVQFGVVNRKHHCRNCGQIFCSKCASKYSTLPKFGIEKEVRVCEACHDKLNKQGTVAPKSTTEGAELPQEYLASSLALQNQAPPAKTEKELQEDEDLQLALALSKSDAENKEKEKLRATHTLLSGIGDPRPASGVSQSSAPPAMDNMDMDPELARYLNRSYWEQKHQHQGENNSKIMGPVSTMALPSAPASSTTSSLANMGNVSPVLRVMEKYQNGETDELDEFVNALRGSIEIFSNRMESNSSRGRSISTDTAVQGLFMNISAMHSHLLRHIQEQDDRRVHFEGLQDKLNQIKDARAALDALREDHQERLRREADEAERQRQIQMAHKLDIMRKKKQEYLEYQRQLALQRMQEQEREMQLRHEQQKHQYMRNLPTGVYLPPQAPYIPPQTHVQAFGPPNSANGSPVHGSFNQPTQPPVTHYQQMPPQFQPADYPSFNMQSMANSLPQVTQGPYTQTQMGLSGRLPLPLQQPPLHIPGMPVNGANGIPPGMVSNVPTVTQHMMMQQGQSIPQHGVVPEMHQPPLVSSHQHQPSVPTEAELISFD